MERLRLSWQRLAVLVAGGLGLIMGVVLLVLWAFGGDGTAPQDTPRDPPQFRFPPPVSAPAPSELPPAQAAVPQPRALQTQPAPPAVRARAAPPRPAPPKPAPPSGARLAIVIDDLGPHRRRTEAAIALPGPLTLAFLGHGRDVSGQAARARDRGHVVFVHVPMEPLDPAHDPGPNALLVGLGAAENLARLAASLDRVPYAQGVNNHMGSRFTADPVALAPVLAAIRDRGLGFLDSRTSPDSQALKLAAQLRMPSAGRDVFLDHDPAPAAVTAALAEAIALARGRGQAVAIGHPHPETLAALADALPGLAGAGVALVGVPALMARPGTPVTP